MKHLKLLPVLFVSLSSVAAPLAGSSWKDAKISEITVYTDGGHDGKGYIGVTFSSNGSGTPSCASNYPRNLVVDLSTAVGAFAASVAQMSRAQVIAMQQVAQTSWRRLAPWQRGTVARALHGTCRIDARPGSRARAKSRVRDTLVRQRARPEGPSPLQRGEQK